MAPGEDWLLGGKAGEDWLLGGKGCTDNPIVLLHSRCDDGVTSSCNLAHCHVSFGREDLRDLGGLGLSLTVFFFFLVCLSTLVYAVSQTSI